MNDFITEIESRFGLNVAYDPENAAIDVTGEKENLWSLTEYLEGKGFINDGEFAPFLGVGIKKGERETINRILIFVNKNNRGFLPIEI